MASASRSHRKASISKTVKSTLQNNTSLNNSKSLPIWEALLFYSTIINFWFYLFTWNFVSPSLKKALICLAAAIPALMLASAVWAPIFFGVEK